MIVGIVGSEEAKFTTGAKEEAIKSIRAILDHSEVIEVVSGKCHLGGIDVWAAQVGKVLGKVVTEFTPRLRSWTYYKERNLQIAERSDIVYCITVDSLPPHFKGMKFDYCYHCKTDAHVKSGGCWTMKQAIKMGKQGVLIVIPNS